MISELGIDAAGCASESKTNDAGSPSPRSTGIPLEAAERGELQRLRRQVNELEKDNAFW
jgi:hypothetical protein